MKNEVLSYLQQKVNDLINAPSCCQEAKDACSNWLKAVGTADEKEATKKLIAEVEADILPIDMLIAFTASEDGKKVFGDKAEAFHAHGLELKQKGAKYCDCPACAACEAIINKKAEILAD